MEVHHGLTAEMYRAVVAIVDERLKELQASRRPSDRPVEAQERTGVRPEEPAAAQARMEAELREYRLQSEERFARIEAALERLAEAQARTEAELREYRVRSEERFARIEATLERLIEAQARTEAAIQELRDAQARTEAQVRELAAAQARTEAQLQDLIKVVARMQDTLASVKGRQLELTYQQRAYAYFGPLLRRVRALSPVDIEDTLEVHLSTEELRDLLAVDLLVSGRPRYMKESPEVWLAVEISAVIDRYDVERARRRAALLRRAGLQAIPAVAGENITPGAKEEAEAQKVLVLLDGHTLFWNEALTEALNQA